MTLLLLYLVNTTVSEKYSVKSVTLARLSQPIRVPLLGEFRNFRELLEISCLIFLILTTDLIHLRVIREE
jgi:hypothetical protein